MAMSTATTRVAAMLAAAIFLISTSFYSASAQAEAPAPSSALAGCMDSLLNTSDCLSFVQAESTITKPDKACCPELAGLVESNPICLCQLLGGNTSAAIGVTIDVKKALTLPSICKIQTPPVSMCSVVGIYVAGVPVGAPAPSAGSTSPAGHAASSPGGQSAAPAPSAGNNTKSGASSIAGFAVVPLTLALAMAAFLPTFF
ncbi:Non-specific lipid transfer protein GPI-anchored 2 [Morella rubra]|uniref:Non-specific lipid transfer protein GPI-anchored 2 n=1 Tax=Morella rubra TaxID=262757 RepID=A0A6A1WNA8_9ROSI|nr:Non-specific lipid transfer protein GPI-anchored 2 [Morella rubra]